MSLKEQIILFSQANTIFGRQGAGLTNMIFSDNLNVLEHSPSSSSAKGNMLHHRFLAKACGHEYRNLVTFEKNSNFGSFSP